MPTTSESVINALVKKTKDGSINWESAEGSWIAKIDDCKCRLRQNGRLTFHIKVDQEIESCNIESQYTNELLSVVRDRVKIPEGLNDEYKRALFLECIVRH